ncbi:MAG: diguanylate cyclase [Oscillospiraceae bacterium]
MKEQDIDILLKQIKTIILNKPVTNELKSASAELFDLQEAISYLADCLSEGNEFLKNLSVGNLEAKAPSRHNFLASSLKELHAGLRHLTWQANQVANGDYKQKVSFLGDFSDSFNQMVSQLEERENGLKSQAEALTKSMNLLVAIMDGLSDWVIVTKMNSGEILYSNHSANKYFYNSKTSLHICGNGHCEFMKQLCNNCNVKTDTQFEYSCPINGKTLSAKSFSVQWNEKLAFVHFISDITDANVEKKQLENLAFNDELTGLYNRRHCLQVLNELVEHKRSFSICMLDLDGLKGVNDNLGHLMGDDYITTVTSTMENLDCDGAIMCRVGGDEFIIIMPGRTELEAKKVLGQFDAAIALIKRIYTVSVSYGIVYVSGDMDLMPDDILKQVDEKMYIVKKAKKSL